MQRVFEDLDRAIALDPKISPAFREHSNANRTSGRLDRALSDANTAMRLDPSDPKAFDYRGNAFNNAIAAIQSPASPCCRPSIATPPIARLKKQFVWTRI